MVEEAYRLGTAAQPCGLFLSGLFPGVSERGNHGGSLLPGAEADLWVADAGHDMPTERSRSLVVDPACWRLPQDGGLRVPRQRDRAWLATGMDRLATMHRGAIGGLAGPIRRSLHAWEARSEALLRRDPHRAFSWDSAYRRMHGIGPYGCRTEPLGTAWLRAVKLSSMYYVAWRLDKLSADKAWDRVVGRMDTTGERGCWWDNLLRDAANTTAGPSALRARRRTLRPGDPLAPLVERWTLHPGFPWSALRDPLDDPGGDRRRRFVACMIATLLLSLSSARRHQTNPLYDAFFSTGDGPCFSQVDFKPAYLYRWACLVLEAVPPSDEIAEMLLLAGRIHQWSDGVISGGACGRGEDIWTGLRDGPLSSGSWMVEERAGLQQDVQRLVRPFLAAVAAELVQHLDLVDARRPW